MPSGAELARAPEASRSILNRSWSGHYRRLWVRRGKSGPSFCKPAGPGAAQTSRRSRPPDGGSPARPIAPTFSISTSKWNRCRRSPALRACAMHSGILSVAGQGGRRGRVSAETPISRRNGRERVCHQLSTAQTRAVTLLQSRLSRVLVGALSDRRSGNCLLHHRQRSHTKDHGSSP